MKALFRGFVFLLFLVIMGPLDPARSLRADTPMEKSWEKVEKAKKKLNEGLKAPKEEDKATYLELAGIIKTESKKARDLDPKMTDTLPADQKEAFLAAFRKDMDAFDVLVDKLTANIQGSQWDEARKTFEEMRAAEKAGHKAYRKKEEKKAS